MSQPTPLQFDLKEVMMLLGEKDLIIFQQGKEIERLSKFEAEYKAMKGLYEDAQKRTPEHIKLVGNG